MTVGIMSVVTVEARANYRLDVFEVKLHGPRSVLPSFLPVYHALDSTITRRKLYKILSTDSKTYSDGIQRVAISNKVSECLHERGHRCINRQQPYRAIDVAIPTPLGLTSSYEGAHYSVPHRVRLC